MKVKLLVSRAGVDFSQNAGEEIEVSDAEGKRLIEANQAEPVGRAPAADKKETTAKKQATEKATK